MGVPAAHVANEGQFRFCMLIGVPVGSARPAGQRLDAAVESRLPTVDVRPALVVPAAGLRNTMFLNIFHQGVAVFHIFCYTVHEA